MALVLYFSLRYRSFITIEPKPSIFQTFAFYFLCLVFAAAAAATTKQNQEGS
jgi:hypothetical protein